MVHQGGLWWYLSVLWSVVGSQSRVNRYVCVASPQKKNCPISYSSLQYVRRRFHEAPRLWHYPDSPGYCYSLAQNGGRSPPRLPEPLQ